MGGDALHVHRHAGLDPIAGADHESVHMEELDLPPRMIVGLDDHEVVGVLAVEDVGAGGAGEAADVAQDPGDAAVARRDGVGAGERDD